jgi:thymidine kinase
MNKFVYVCGLDGDFQMKKIGNVLDIIPFADEVIKKQALCAICRNGKKASFTKRLSDESSQKLIGTNNYIPVCRKCHKS